MAVRNGSAHARGADVFRTVSSIGFYVQCCCISRTLPGLKMNVGRAQLSWRASGCVKWTRVYKIVSHVMVAANVACLCPYYELYFTLIISFTNDNVGKWCVFSLCVSGYTNSV